MKHIMHFALIASITACTQAANHHVTPFSVAAVVATTAIELVGNVAAFGPNIHCLDPGFHCRDDRDPAPYDTQREREAREQLQKTIKPVENPIAYMTQPILNCSIHELPEQKTDNQQCPKKTKMECLELELIAALVQTQKDIIHRWLDLHAELDALSHASDLVTETLQEIQKRTAKATKDDLQN